MSIATFQEKDNIVQMLMQAGADINLPVRETITWKGYTFKKGATAAMIAKERGNLTGLKLFRTRKRTRTKN